MPAWPKPEPHQKKPRKPLKSNSRLKTKSRIKQGNGNPFPDAVKKKIFLAQGGKCAYLEIEVPTYKDLEYHHVEAKGHASAEWQHDYRNGVGLLPPYHTPLIHMGNNQSYWKYFWIMRNVFKFGWWAGEEISLEDWVERNELRLCRAKIDVQKLVRDVFLSRT